MTTLTNRPNTALMVIDVQNGVVAGSHDRDGVIGNINALVHKARAEEVPVVWVQHSDEGLEQGSDDWRIVDELAPGDDEPVVQKHYGDSFEDTDLERILATRGIGRVVVTGAQSDACIRSTLHGAFVRGYDVTLVGDAHTTEDLTAVRRSVTRPGHLAHQPVLGVVHRRRQAGRRRHDRRDRLRGAVRLTDFGARTDSCRDSARWMRTLQPNP